MIFLRGFAHMNSQFKGLFGLCPHLPSQIEGAPIFWLGIRPPSFRQRVGVKSNVVTNFLVWLA
jgi:hypothetical protein